MDKEDVVNIYNGILLSHETNEIMPFVTTWMDLEITIMNEEISQRKTNIYDTKYMQSLKNDTNKLIYKIEPDSQTENKFRITKVEEKV